MTTKIRIITISLAIFISLSFAANASDVTIPNAFTDGSPAKADEVNANFDAVKQAVDDNNAQLQTKDCVTCDNDVLTVPSIRYTEAKEGSVTYSAMGFTPDEGNVIFTGANPYNLTTRYTKDSAQGFLRLYSGSGTFYHNITLPSGVKMTSFRAHVQSNGTTVRVNLVKRTMNDGDDDLAGIIAPPNSDGVILAKNFTSEVIESWEESKQPVSYYIEVTLSALTGANAGRFYSAVIEYEYDEP